MFVVVHGADIRSAVVAEGKVAMLSWYNFLKHPFCVLQKNPWQSITSLLVSSFIVEKAAVPFTVP